jgi:hypothetical protein
MKTELFFVSNDTNHTIVLFVPANTNDGNYQRIHRDIERIQFF